MNKSKQNFEELKRQYYKAKYINAVGTKQKEKKTKSINEKGGQYDLFALM